MKQKNYLIPVMKGSLYGQTNYNQLKTKSFAKDKISATPDFTHAHTYEKRYFGHNQDTH